MRVTLLVLVPLLELFKSETLGLGRFGEMRRFWQSGTFQNVDMLLQHVWESQSSLEQKDILDVWESF